VQCLLFLKKHHAKGYVMNHDMMMTVIENEEIRFHKNMRGVLSVFAMGEKAEGVTISNMKYELTDAEITNDFPIGISNCFTEKEGIISVRNGSLLLVVYWE
jgi:thiamine pyrophosphokinase